MSSARRELRCRETHETRCLAAPVRRHGWSAVRGPWIRPRRPLRSITLCLAPTIQPTSSSPAPPESSSAAPFAFTASQPQPLPAALPPPPDGDSTWELLLYLARLTLGRRSAARVAAVLLLLLISRASGLAGPLLFKQAVAVAQEGAACRTLLLGALGAAGVCRALSGIAASLQGIVFAPVAQAAGRRMACHALAHVLSADLAWHRSRRTGSLSRSIERGTKATTAVYNALVFGLLPTAVELPVVCAALAACSSPAVASIAAVTSASFVAYTLALTPATTSAKRAVKRQDNAISAVAVDALLNAEAVMLYSAQQQVAAEYDEQLAGYEVAAVDSEAVTARLMAGQVVLLGAGLTAALVAFAVGAAPGAASAADLVLLQGLLLLLWAPLSSVGGLYRRLRKALVDLEDLITVLRTRPSLVDGPLEL